MRFIGALVIGVAGCAPDSTFSDIARKHIVEKGPAGACCTELNASISSPECAAEAQTKCAFAKDATVKVVSVTRAESNTATVDLGLSGPNGNGVCSVVVSDFAGGRKRSLKVQSAHCKPR